ncbi:MAG: hypothetical protein MUC33_01290 [Desulfobacterales bacterium]|jgi:hypothetical protein|nr:hypothetical protein [Desulfobacterales bacterium]MCU0601277.1 hypothetical protein [Desulfobacterales bacterium]
MKNRARIEKIFTLAGLCLLLFAQASAFVEPYLSADPQTDATKYRIRLSTDGTTWGAWTVGPAVSNAMRFDLGGVPPADYSGQAQAGAVLSVTDQTTGQTTTADRWSTSAPFLLKVPSLSQPKGMAVINEGS